MNETEWLAERFSEHRAHLRAVAYRMLGSLSEADDAVQDTWLRVSRSDTTAVENMGGWLTTITARLCLNRLRARRSRPEEPLDVHVPDPIVSSISASNPEHEALLADSVGLALLIVLETLSPAERLAFVLHDMFAVPFEEIGAMIDRSPTAVRQLASRARRRVKGANPTPDTDLNRQREIADAFHAAARGGDFDALVAVLDPDVVLRVDFGAAPAGPSRIIRGAKAVASQALMFSQRAPYSRPALVNGVAGFVTAPGGKPLSVMALTVRNGRIVAIDILADPARLATLDISDLDD